MRRVHIIAFLLLLSGATYAQDNLPSLKRQKTVILKDSVFLDSLSLIPEYTTLILEDGSVVDTSLYSTELMGQYLFVDKDFHGKKATVKYRVISTNLKKSFKHKDTSIIGQTLLDAAAYVPEKYRLAEKRNKIQYASLNKNGLISRGVRVGNQQSLGLDSRLDLQLSGNLTDEVEILAAITDNQIPVEPEGNTAQIQDFDQVYIELKTRNEKLRFGDFLLQNEPESYFMKYTKKTQGISFEGNWETGDSSFVGAEVAGSFARGQFARNTFNGEEGVQGPYRLSGNNNELFVIVIAGTERVFINGQLMKRGEQYDYVINYNTGEITFTPNQLITQFDRITVEYQYANRAYERSIVQSSASFKNRKWNLKAEVYSEQDNRNQPLQQELGQEALRSLSLAGDSIERAIIPGGDSVGYEEGRILYQKIDTIGYSGVYQYSTDPNLAVYQVQFSYVGQGNGNYRLQNSLANGRVYQWVQPRTGQPAGDYAAVQQLIPADNRRLLSLQTAYRIDSNTRVELDLAGSQRDLNTFSPLNAADDNGLALHAKIIDRIDLGNTWFLRSRLEHEFKGENFNFIERYRPVEFERQWNRSLNNPRQTLASNEENWSTANIELGKSSSFSIQNQTSGLIRKEQSRGIGNLSQLKWKPKNWRLSLTNDFTRIEDSAASMQALKKTFWLNQANASRNLKFFWLNTGFLREDINIENQKTTLIDSSSYSYNQYSVGLSSPDTFLNPYELKYTYREDFRILDSKEVLSGIGESIKFQSSLFQRGPNSLTLNLNYRTFDNKLNLSDEQEESYSGRVEGGFQLFKRAIITNIYYQLNTGQEQRNSFQFLETRQIGQGNYIWRDLNNNGERELNEFFEPTQANAAEANFIRVITPTNTFVRSVANELNQNIDIQPSLFFKNKSLANTLASYVSNSTSLQTARKTIDDGSIEQINPFSSKISDSLLVKNSSQFRNTIFFNQQSTRFSGDFTFIENQNKRLLSQGFDASLYNEKRFRVQYNLNTFVSLVPEYSYGFQRFASDFFADRNFQIRFNESKIQNAWQFSRKWRLGFSYTYQQKLSGQENLTRLYSNEFETELNFNIPSKGSMNASFAYLNTKFNGKNDNARAYQMLEGFEIGNNYFWNLVLTYSINENVQLNILYNGRTAESINARHTASINARYMF